MNLRVWDNEQKKYVEKVESIKLDHLGEGRPVTFVAEGKEWAFGTRFELRINEINEITKHD